MSEPISPNVIGNIISDVIGIQTDFQALLARLDKISQQVQLPSQPPSVAAMPTVAVAESTLTIAEVPEIPTPIVPVSKPKAPISLYCDGVTFLSGRPGQWAAAGIVAVGGHSKTLFQRSFPLGNYTCSASGLMAIQKGLEEAVVRFPARDLDIYSSLRHLVKVAKGEWVKGANLDIWENIEALLAQARANGSTVKFHFLPADSDNPHKQAADKLARGNHSLALDE